MVIQVCNELNVDYKQREIEGLVEAMKKFDLSDGTILTFYRQDELKYLEKPLKFS